MWQWQIWIPKQQKTTKKQILIPVCGWIQFVCLCPPTCILKDRSSPNQFTERFSLQVQGCVITIFCGLLPGVGVIEAVGEGVVWSVRGNVGGFARWWYLKGIWLGYGVGFSVLWVSHVRRRLFQIQSDSGRNDTMSCYLGSTRYNVFVWEPWYRSSYWSSGELKLSQWCWNKSIASCKIVGTSTCAVNLPWTFVNL